MLSSRSALTGGFQDIQQLLAAVACSGTDKSSKARKAGPLERCSFPHGPIRLSICLISIAKPEQLSPLSRRRQHDSFSPTCKHESLWGTLYIPENFIHLRMKLLWHPSPSISDGKTNIRWNLLAIPLCWSPLGRRCWVPQDSTALWLVDGVPLTWVCKRHLGREMTYWKVQVGTRIMIFVTGSLPASISKALDFVSHLRCRNSSKVTIWQWL